MASLRQRARNECCYRDPTFFKYVLAYLEDPKPTTIPATRSFMEKVMMEADFYCVTPLVKALQNVLDSTSDDDMFPQLAGGYAVFRNYVDKTEPHYAVFFERERVAKVSIIMES